MSVYNLPAIRPIVSVTGDVATDKALAAIPERLRNKIVRRGLRMAAKPVQLDMKRGIQKDTKAAMTTIKIRSPKRTRRSRYRLTIQIRTDVKALHQIHTRIPTVFNPHWLEFGVPNHAWLHPFPFRPFARPAVKRKRPLVIMIFRAMVIAEVSRIP